MDYSLPGSSVHGIFQGTTLEWIISSSRGTFWPSNQIHVSCTTGGFFFNTESPAKPCLEVWSTPCSVPMRAKLWYWVTGEDWNRRAEVKKGEWWGRANEVQRENGSEVLWQSFPRQRHVRGPLLFLSASVKVIHIFIASVTSPLPTPSSNNTREDSTHGHHQMVNTEIRLIIFFAPLPFTSLLFSAICKVSSDNHFAYLHFFSLGTVFITTSYTMPQSSFHSSLGTLSVRSNPLNLFVTSTV